MSTEEGLKKGLIGLAVASVVAGGIAGYFFLKKDYLTWEEYTEAIATYNAKIQEIKNDCDIDTRCLMVDGEKRVNFGGVKTKKDVSDKLNKWIEEDEKNPQSYKNK